MKTISHALHAVFPLRPAEEPGDGPTAYFAMPSMAGRERNAPYVRPPLLPFDVFAITGHLLQLSGAYHHVLPSDQSGGSCGLLVSPEDISLVREVAAAWRAFDWKVFMDAEGIKPFRRWIRAEGHPLSFLYEWWDGLFAANADAAIFVEPTAAAPVWWRLALMLFMAADEAAEGVGFTPLSWQGDADDDPAPWFERVAYFIFFRLGSAYNYKTDGTAETPAITTLSAADKNILSVLPKGRTPSVGCTMRSMSHHLCLMPPQGHASARWVPFLFDGAPPDEQHMNIMIVPFPYTVAASSFRTKVDRAVAERGSGFFSVDQQWLKAITPERMVDFIVELAKGALTDLDRIHAVVLPELALDSIFYGELARSLPKRLPGLELLVSGVSDDDGRHGNFVNVTVFQTRPASGGEPLDTTIGMSLSREKHHRWRLDRGQIVAYGLEGVMSPTIAWWEDIDLLSRRVDLAVVRAGSVVSALICEDLARVDPCQELIRAAGPSLIFALLMDAPQLRARWPARHATILAEDPGSAVLTVTSKGLMTRQDRLGIHTSRTDDDRVVALWRDDGSMSPVEIACGKASQAVLLTLSGTRTTETTLDGRKNGAAVSWRYAAHRPVSLPAGQDYADVIGTEGRAD